MGMAGVRRLGVPDCQLPRLGEAGAGEYGEGQAGRASWGPRPEEARRMMAHQEPITGTGLRTPRAAAAAGIGFSLLLGLALCS
jgi:hypothetical protein